MDYHRRKKTPDIQIIAYKVMYSSSHELTYARSTLANRAGRVEMYIFKSPTHPDSFQSVIKQVVDNRGKNLLQPAGNSKIQYVEQH